MEKREPFCTVRGNVNWYSHYGEQYRGSLKTKNRTTIWPSNPTTGHIPWESHSSKRVMCHNVHCSFVYNDQDIEATQVSIERWMDKEDVGHIYNGILLHHKKKGNWVICIEVDGPRVCHTEWSKSEREKQKPYANTYRWNLKKKKMVLKNLGAGQE